MYIIKNAIANLHRNKGRNLLIGIVLFIIIVIAALSIIIHTTSTSMIHDYKQRFGSEVSIQNNDGNLKQLDTDMLLAFGKSDALQSKHYLAKTGYMAKHLQAVDDDDDPASLKGYLLGSSREDINDEFQKGTYKLVEGSRYKNKKECIISKQFAQINQLTIGDSITLQSNDALHPFDLVLTISGIYEDVSLHPQTNAYRIALTNRSNEIYASFETVMDSALFQNIGSLELKMFLKDPELLSDFKKELKAKGLPESYSVTTDEEGYQKIIAPVEHLLDISTSMMIGVFTLGSFLLMLISIMVMKERTYEIGVLRAIGMKKIHVIYGLLCETIILMGICLVLGLGCAQLGAKPLAHTLLTSQQPYETMNQNNQEPSQQQLEASLSIETIGVISILAFALALIASAGSILFTIRYEPMKILNEQTS